jgi:hypothetical protein
MGDPDRILAAWTGRIKIDLAIATNSRSVWDCLLLSSQHLLSLRNVMDAFGTFRIVVIAFIAIEPEQHNPLQFIHLCSKSTGAVTSCTRKYLASAGYFRATASYIA